MCSRYLVPLPLFQPFWWLSAAFVWVDTWATAFAEVRKPSGSPLLRLRRFRPPVSGLSRTPMLQASVLGKLWLLKRAHAVHTLKE